MCDLMFDKRLLCVVLEK